MFPCLQVEKAGAFSGHVSLYLEVLALWSLGRWMYSHPSKQRYKSYHFDLLVEFTIIAC